MSLSQSSKHTFVAIDLETTGKYPLQAEICELAAVKWHNGRVVDEYQSLVKPSHIMSDEVIKIHNITNEMVANSPKISEVLEDFYNFIRGHIIVAHHAPFDCGFLAIDFENHGLKLKTQPILCSSLISLKIFPESPNHRLQTLIRVLNIPQGQAHRALDDAKASLMVLLKCFDKLNFKDSLEDWLNVQGEKLEWKHFSIKDITAKSHLREIVKAIKSKEEVQITYQGGSRPGQARTIQPIGLVRNPRGDFLVASDSSERPPKHYFLDKITQASY